jgi:DNA-directed RNA polymerase subunit N (RpoN/RPB10)
MLYSTCPTCGYFLGQKIIEWETKSKEICNNPNQTKEEKEKLKEELLKTVKLRRYCCRMRLMSYKDIVQDILAVDENM